MFTGGSLVSFWPEHFGLSILTDREVLKQPMLDVMIATAKGAEMARTTAGRALIVIIGGLFFLTGVAAREGVWAKREVAREVTFERDIRPIFVARCLGCHNGARQSGGLRLDRREAAVRDSIIVPGRAAESHLYQRITATGTEAMPPRTISAPFAPPQSERPSATAGKGCNGTPRKGAPKKMVKIVTISGMSRKVST